MISQISTHASFWPKTRILLSFATIGIFWLLAMQAAAQNTQTTENKADQNLKSSARVNPVTLAMEFSLPLGGYPSRGGNSTPIALNYSSKVWTASLTNVREDRGLLPNPQIPYYYLQSSDIAMSFGGEAIAGWNSGLQPPQIISSFDMYRSSGDIYSPQVQSGQQQNDLGDCWFDRTEVQYSSACGGLAWVPVYWCEVMSSEGIMLEQEEYGDPDCFFGGGPVPTPSPTPIPSPTLEPTPYPTPDTTMFIVDRARIQMPDGNRVEFRKDDKVTDCSINANCFPSASGTYLAVDGSGMRFERGETQPNTNGEIDDVLYMPNGSKYVFPTTPPVGQAALASKFIDMNGNVSQYDQTTRKWTDSVGRQISNDFPSPSNISGLSTGTHPLSVKGLNNSDIEYQVDWEKLHTVFDEPNTTLHYSGSDTCSSILDNPLSPALFTNAPVDHQVNQAGNASIDITIRKRACAGLGAPALFDPIVLASVTAPNGQKTEFKYNEYGEITKILYPTGGWEKFEYGYVQPVGLAADFVYGQTNRGVKIHTVSNGTNTSEWNYEQVWDPKGYGVRVTAPDGSVDEKVLQNSSESIYGFEDPRAGAVVEERTKNSLNGQLTSRLLNDWTVLGPQGANSFSKAKRDPQLKRSVRFVFEPNSNSALATLSETEYETPGSGGAPSDPTYFAHLNVKSNRTYNYANVPKAAAESGSLDWNTIESWFTPDKLASISETDYSYDPNYRARGMIGRPTETRVLNPLNPGDVLAKTQSVYDEANYLDTTDTTTNWLSPNSNLRGNVTTKRLWDKDSNTWLESHTMFDNFGNPRKVWDASGDANKFVETQYDPANKYAYPTKVIAPAPNPPNTNGTNQTSTVETTYDFTTGLPLSVKDDFGQISTTEYDAMLRPIRVNPVVVNGTPTGPKTETVYGQPDSNGQLPSTERFVKVRKQLDANNWDEATTWFDGLGRTIKTQAKDSQGDVFVETHYDQFGRVDRVTNPYRAGDTVYWSKTRYDELGRAVESYAPATLANLATAQSLGVTSFDISTVPGYFGTVVETKDAANKRSRSITNALGQLIVVEEPDSGGNLQPLPQSTPPPVPSPTPTPTPGPTPTPTPIPTPTPGGGGGEGGHGCVANCPQNFAPTDYPSYATFYTYNVQGKMVQVTQGDQNRYFKYDSLGRLIRVSQPEQEYNASLNLSDYYNLSDHWTAGFVYDVLGNVVRATDANGVNIINEYDRAGRVTKRCYTKPNVTTSATTCSAIASSDQSLDTQTVNFYYDGKGLDTPQSPNFAKGKLTKVDNGVSQTLYTQFDNFGRLLSTEQRTPLDGQTIANATPYVSSYQYNLSGALVQETYPSGRVVKNDYESDGDLADVTSKKAGSNMYLPYVYDFSYTAAGGISQMRLGNGRFENAKFNNRLQVTELGLGNSATDASVWKTNYEYGEPDGSGNVDATKNTGNIARQTLTVPGASFVQSYNYDSLYRLTQAKETSGSAQNWIQNWSYDRYGNRTNFTQNVAGLAGGTAPAVDTNTNRFTSTDFHYDKNGNVVQDIDPVSSHNRQFVFNGDNKQVQVKDLDSSGQSIGQYFYDGEGKRVKKVTDQETTVFVYSSGKLVAEYSTQLSQHPAISYTTTDHLGSPRIVTDELGQVRSRQDFMPFGEDLFAGIGNRTGETGLKYSVSGADLRQKFTGYQKDNETNLDFAEARMYANTFGRFTAVDPLLASGKSANPQSFNRFVYTGNNPIIVTDPTGMDWFQHFNKDTNRWEYRDESSSPGDGWDPVKFGDKDYTTVSDWCWNGQCSGSTAYLYKAGKWDYGAQAHYGLSDAVWDTSIAGLKWGYNSLATVNNVGWGIAARASLEYLTTGNPRDVPYASYYEFSNETQANANISITVGSILFPALSAGRGASVGRLAALSETVDTAGSVSTARGVGTTAIQYEQYSLRAMKDGMYPVMKRGFKDPVGSVFLKQGEVWKFGQTMNGPARYSGAFLRNTGEGLVFKSEFAAPTLRQVLQIEKQKILDFELTFGELPAGNKIRR